VKKTTERAPVEYLDLRIEPTSIDKARRTVEVVWSTGARVRRTDYWSGEEYDEELGLGEGEVRMGRLNGGANVLDSHGMTDPSLRSVIGVVERAWIAGPTEARALLRFSDHPDFERIWHDVERGIIRNVSNGYRRYARREVTTAQDKVKVFRMVDWEPFEISMVGVPADAGASVRADPRVAMNECTVLRLGDEDGARDMTIKKTGGAGQEQDVGAGEPASEATRAQPATAVATPPAPAPTNTGDATRAVELERDRGIAIRSLTRKAKLPDAVADDLIARNVPIEQAREQLLERWAGAEPAVQSSAVTVTREEHDGAFRAMEQYLLHRYSPDKYKLPAGAEGERAASYRGLSLLEIGREVLDIRGVKHRGLSKMQVAELAFRAGATHTSADFPYILANVANKTLRDAYEETPQTFRMLGRRGTIPDFKPVSRTQLGGVSTLVKVNEAGEYTYGTVGEAKESFALGTYGKILSFTRQAMVNDDMNAFSRIPAAFGGSARRMESDVWWSIVTTNAALNDTVALFHATHANLGAQILVDATDIDELYQLMSLQKGLANEYLNLQPRFLVVPNALAVKAWQLVVATTQPAQDSNTNPFKGRLEPIVEPRLQAASAAVWYMFADPAQIDTIEYAFLEGEEGPVIETRLGWEIDGMEIKCREDFGAKAIDHRGMAKSAATT
jgi:hypothetical protein